MNYGYEVEALTTENEVATIQQRDHAVSKAEAELSPLKYTPRSMKRKLLKKRGRLLKDGQLTMIVHGADETMLWNHRVGMFRRNMRDVLGDRKKTFEWCGSVVDSVVGAFLTQNVSDSLSSRAYMELVSRWPSINKELSNSDTVDWESVRKASQEDLADAIKCRGMQYNLSANIKGFLEGTRAWNLRRKHPKLENAFLDEVVLVMDDIIDGIVSNDQCCLIHKMQQEKCEGVDALFQKDFPCLTKDEHIFTHETHLPRAYMEHKIKNASDLLSLEWLREASGNEAHEFLMGIPGLGRKSVACIMLLALGMKEFPVDTNVGRICSRLGWIPLEAGHAIEDLDDYAPEPEVHAFLRSRLLNFPIDTLYELHYQMITLGKVFCSKSDPNCKACPMQSHCEYAENDGPSLHGRKRQKVWQYEDNNTIKTPQKVEKAKKFTDTSDHILYGAGGTANIKFEHDWEARDLPLEHLISLRSTRVRSHRRINIRLDDASNTLIEEMKTELYYLASHSLYQRFTPWIPVQLLRECHDKESRSIWDAVDDKEHVIEVVTCLPRDINSFSSDLSAMPVWDMEDIGTWDTEVMPSARLYKYSKYALNANNLEEAPGYSKINKGNVVETALEREDVQQGDQSMGDNQVGEPDSINALKMGFEVPPAEMTFPTEKGMEDTELGCLIENLHQFEIELEAINSLTETSMETHGADSDSNKLSAMGLRILGITEENKQDGHDSILVLARQKYHYYARLLHPDKCKQKNAVSAFILLSKLIDFVSRQVQSSKMIENPSSKMQQTLLLQSTEMRSNACGSASTTSSLKIDLQHRLTWSQSRLVVLGYRMSTELQAPCLQRYSAVTQKLLQSEELVFLPLHNLPTINSNLKKEEVKNTIAGEVDDILQEMICSISGEASHLSAMVDGLLLVPSRSALEGRFPLNGTYFQINEIFLDQSTVCNTLKIPGDMLSQCQEVTIYFGLGIHYLAKGMSQEEVEDMFTDGLVCFRAYNPETQAPMPLPSFLTPNAPKNNKTVGKTLQAMEGGTKVPRIPVAMQAPGHRVPFFSPQRALNFSGEGLSLQQNTHRRRRYLFPAISLSRRCGHCKSCLNPSWKKACEVRRAEMLQALQPNTYA